MDLFEKQEPDNIYPEIKYQTSKGPDPYGYYRKCSFCGTELKQKKSGIWYCPYVNKKTGFRCGRIYSDKKVRIIRKRYVKRDRTKPHDKQRGPKHLINKRLRV